MKKQKVYIGEGGKYDGFIFIDSLDGNYVSFCDDALYLFIGYGKNLLIKESKLIPIGTL